MSQQLPPGHRYESLSVAVEGPVCRVRLEQGAIDERLVAELLAVLARCEDDAATPAVSVLVLEGGAEVFCSGGDLAASAAAGAAGTPSDPEPLYDLWQRLATGPFVSVAAVQGRANAGGLGFVAACDLVLAGPAASFGLSELLFGLFPACVLPFLARRVGEQRAHVLTLTTQPIGAEQARDWGLVDLLEPDLERLLQRQLARLTRLSRPAVARYKRYRAELAPGLAACRPAALAANRALFADPEVQRNIRRYVTEMKFPWEA